MSLNSVADSLLIDFLSFPQVAGPYLTQYDVYYKRLDPQGQNEIGAVDAAKFLKFSKLSDEILGKVGQKSPINEVVIFVRTLPLSV